MEPTFTRLNYDTTSGERLQRLLDLEAAMGVPATTLIGVVGYANGEIDEIPAALLTHPWATGVDRIREMLA